VASTQVRTASAATIMEAVICSLRMSADQSRVSTGWASCVWPILATPPSARPRYQAKKPRNMLTALT